jgi:hypothetical protein
MVRLVQLDCSLNQLRACPADPVGKHGLLAARQRLPPFVIGKLKLLG